VIQALADVAYQSRHYQNAYDRYSNRQLISCLLSATKFHQSYTILIARAAPPVSGKMLCSVLRPIPTVMTLTWLLVVTYLLL